MSIGLDRNAENFRIGLNWLGFWILMFLTKALRYFRNIEGVQIVLRLVSVALPEVLGLLVVFTFMYLFFVMTAMTFFGASEPAYASFPTCNWKLLQFFLGGNCPKCHR